MNAARITILSVNVGLPAIIGRYRGEEILSGIVKTPVQAPEVMVRATNIDGDGQADLENHGGLDKAVYAYPASHWPWWTAEKNLACAPAGFGENLTLADVAETDVRIGDRFRWGEAVLEVSQPRAPCYKLGMLTRRPEIPAVMTASRRCGWYLRVLQEGNATTRDAVLLRIAESDGPTVHDAFATAFSMAPDKAALQRIHACPALSAAWRSMIAKKIAVLGA